MMRSNSGDNPACSCEGGTAFFVSSPSNTVATVGPGNGNCPVIIS